MKDKFKIKIVRKEQLEDKEVYIYGGYVEDDEGLRCGFVAMKTTEGEDTGDHTLCGDDLIEIIPGSAEIHHVEIIDDALLIGGTTDEGRGYAARVEWNDDDIKVDPMTLDVSLSCVRQIMEFTIGDTSRYALIGSGEGTDGWITSIVSIIDSNLNTVKAIIMKDADDEKLMPVTFLGMDTDGMNLFVCGVINPSESVAKGIGVVMKLSDSLEKLNAISFTSDTAEAVIVRSITLVDDELNLMCEVISNGAHGIIEKSLDLELNEIVRKESTLAVD